MDAEQTLLASLDAARILRNQRRLEMRELEGTIFAAMVRVVDGLRLRGGGAVCADDPKRSGRFDALRHTTQRRRRLRRRLALPQPTLWTRKQPRFVVL